MRGPTGSTEVKDRRRRSSSGTQSFLVELGRKIRRHRKLRGWSRGMLARKLRVTENRLGRWERGERSPPVAILRRLEDVFGVTL